MSTHVDILLATYNNERHVLTLLESVLEQTHTDWRILTRDDGSKDRTARRVREFADAHADRITVFNDNRGNLGPCQNFCGLLAESKADYVMFCDADDVWLPTKIEKTLAEMKRIEAQDGADSPVLVHTDLRVVNDRLRTIAESFWQFQNLKPASDGLNRLLTQNNITGCTMMVNAALRSLAVPVPGSAAMHDHWMGLIAASFGRIGAVDEPLILYRQHGGNALGASGWGRNTILERLTSGLGPLRKSYRVLARQAQAFHDRFAERLDPRRARTVHAFARLPYENFLRRRYMALRYGLYKSGVLRNIMFFLSM